MRFNTNRDTGYRENEEFSRFLGLGARGACQSFGAREVPSCQERAEAPINKVKSLAMVYPEKQAFIMIYDPEIALENGTMFEELNKPFFGGSCRKNNSGEGC